MLVFDTKCTVNYYNYYNFKVHYVGFNELNVLSRGLSFLDSTTWQFCLGGTYLIQIQKALFKLTKIHNYMQLYTKENFILINKYISLYISLYLIYIHLYLIKPT